jgi:hypothetical protein
LLTVTDVLYLRVPGPLKHAVEARAGERGLSQTAAAVELLERGLQAIADDDAVNAVEAKLAASAGELERVGVRLERVQYELKAAREREQLTARTYAAFAERAGHELASCPQCHRPLCGSDLLVSGHCPHCDTPLTSLLAPTRFGSLVVHEYVALLGALGVLAGLAVAASSEEAGAGRARGRERRSRRSDRG